MQVASSESDLAAIMRAISARGINGIYSRAYLGYTCGYSRNGTGLRHRERVGAAHTEGNLLQLGELLVLQSNKALKLTGKHTACVVAQSNGSSTCLDCRLDSKGKEILLAASGVVCNELNVGAECCALCDGIADIVYHSVGLLMEDIFYLHGTCGRANLKPRLFCGFERGPGIVDAFLVHRYRHGNTAVVYRGRDGFNSERINAKALYALKLDNVCTELVQQL